ncbi:hypothetical protein [Piscibacillus halophilus]|nr:hypothetical protein [Piscibacillus halophilus]
MCKLSVLLIAFHQTTNNYYAHVIKELRVEDEQKETKSIDQMVG